MSILFGKLTRKNRSLIGTVNDEDLHDAAAQGDIKLVRSLFEKGADVNAQGGYFGNALQAAASKGHSDIVNLLLEKGADVNAQGGYFGNALQAAASKGHSDIVNLLLEKGADVNAQGGHYGNALQIAASMGHSDIVNLLLGKGADVNAQGGYFGNALQAAASKGHSDIVNLLLEKGADVNTQGGRFGNALQAAAGKGHSDIMNLLIEKGADVNAQGGHYGNALQIAASMGHSDIVNLLIEKGADVNAQGGRVGNALQTAAWGGILDIVNLLLEKGADVNAQGGRFGNALQAAAWGGNSDIVNLLLEKGADVNAQGGRHGNALKAATRGGHSSIVDILTKAADLDRKTQKIKGQLRSAEGELGLEGNAYGKLSTEIERSTVLSQNASTLGIDVRMMEEKLVPLHKRHDVFISHEKLVINKSISDLAVLNRYSDWTLVPYRSVKQLGSGGFGAVDAVKVTQGRFLGNIFARKTVVIKADDQTFEKERQQVLDEIKALRGLRHHHIVQIIASYSLDEEKQYGLIMDPIAEKDLEAYLTETSKSNELVRHDRKRHLRRWIGCLADALEYIHIKRIQHRDIKPSNVLIRGEQIYLCDFGISKLLGDGNTATSWSREGTRRYLPPEVLNSETPDFRRGRSADVFAMGCIFIEMVNELFDRTPKDFRQFRDPIGTSPAYAESYPKVLDWLMLLLTEALAEAQHEYYDTLLAKEAICLSFLMLDPDSERRLRARQLNDELSPSGRQDCLANECCSSCRSKFASPLIGPRRFTFNSQRFLEGQNQGRTFTSWKDAYDNWFDCAIPNLGND